jgi:hypothetical protein
LLFDLWFDVPHRPTRELIRNLPQQARPVSH